MFIFYFLLNSCFIYNIFLFFTKTPEIVGSLALHS